MWTKIKSFLIGAVNRLWVEPCQMPNKTFNHALNSSVPTASQLRAEKTFTTDDVFTAMCLWEAAVELKADSPRFAAYWDEIGTVCMRYEVALLVKSCEATWSKKVIANPDISEAFDWGHCPSFLEEHYRQEFD